MVESWSGVDVTAVASTDARMRRVWAANVIGEKVSQRKEILIVDQLGWRIGPGGSDSDVRRFRREWRHGQIAPGENARGVVGRKRNFVSIRELFEFGRKCRERAVGLRAAD